MFHSRSTASVLWMMLFSLLLTILVMLPSNAGHAGAIQPATPETASPTTSSDTVPGPQFIIRPAEDVDGSYFTLEAEVGTSNELAVELGNAGNVPLSLTTYVADTIPVSNGGFNLADQDSEPTGAATWIDYPTETLQLEGGEQIERRFTVSIPEDALPGQYIAGIAVQTAEPLEIEGTTQFTQVIRKTIAILISVPGPEQAAFQVGDPAILTDGPTETVTFQVENTGNVLVRPQGELTLQDNNGEHVLTAPIQMQSVYAGKSAPLFVTLSASVPDGDYMMSLELEDEATGATTSVSDERITISNEEEVPEQFDVIGEISLQPDPEEPVFAEVAAVVTNNGEAVSNAEVILDVMKDGEVVESFTLASSLSLPQGATELSERYIPPTGFEPGTWTFELRLNVIDADSNASTTVATVQERLEFEIGE